METKTDQLSIEKTALIRVAIVLLVILVATAYVLVHYHVFKNIWWTDVAYHFMGGFILAMILSSYMLARIGKGREEGLKNFLMVVGAATLLGVLWEFFEYAQGQFFLINPKIDILGLGSEAGHYADTMQDLLLDILGASFFMALPRKR